MFHILRLCVFKETIHCYYLSSLYRYDFLTFWNLSCINTSLFSKLKEPKDTYRLQDPLAVVIKSPHLYNKPHHNLLSDQNARLQQIVKTKQALSAQEVLTFKRLFWLCYLVSITNNSVKQPFQHNSNWHCSCPNPLSPALSFPRAGCGFIDAADWRSPGRGPAAHLGGGAD